MGGLGERAIARVWKETALRRGSPRQGLGPQEQLLVVASLGRLRREEAREVNIQAVPSSQPLISCWVSGGPTTAGSPKTREPLDLVYAAQHPWSIRQSGEGKALEGQMENMVRAILTMLTILASNSI